MQNGWISLHRKIKDHWVFSDPDKFRAWIIVLLEVNHSPQKVLINNTLIEVGRGESVKNLDTWTHLFGNEWNKSKTRRFFGLLKKDSMIELKPTRKTTHLCVCNYDTYQSGRNASESQVKRKRNASESQVKLNNKEKNELNEKQFTLFYSVYPKKKSKATTLKAFNKINPDQELFDLIMVALEVHKKHWTDPQYIPHPSTWLNQKRWEDVFERPADKPAELDPSQSCSVCEDRFNAPMDEYLEFAGMCSSCRKTNKVTDAREA